MATSGISRQGSVVNRQGSFVDLGPDVGSSLYRNSSQVAEDVVPPTRRSSQEANHNNAVAALPHPMNQHLGTELAAYGTVESYGRLSYVSSRSRRWAISAHWFGNLLSLLSCAAVLSTIATLSSLNERLVLPAKLILAIVVSEAVVAVLSVGGCFLRPLAIRALNSVMKVKNRYKYIEYQELATSSSPVVRGPGARRRRRHSAVPSTRAVQKIEEDSRCLGCKSLCNCETAIMLIYFTFLVGLFAWRLWMMKALLDWMGTVRSSQELTFYMTDIGLNFTSEEEQTRIARRTFDGTFGEYYSRLSSSQWVTAQDYLGCCGFYNLNLSLEGAATGSVCSENYSSIAIAFNASCAYELEDSSRSQSRLLVTIIMAVAFIQAVNLVVFWEMVYPAFVVVKTKVQQKLHRI